MKRNTDHVRDTDATRQATFIADDYDIRQRTDDYPDGDWVGETGDCDLTERIVALLNALAGIQNPAAIPQLVEAAEDSLNDTVDASTYPDGPCMSKHIRDALKDALAALDKSVPDASQSATLSGGKD